MAGLMIEAKKNNQKALEDEESVFEDYNHKKVPRGTNEILRDIQSQSKSELKFKVVCNKLYALMDGHLNDQNNPLNMFVAILGEDYDNNPIIVSLIDELCSRHELFTELKPKGILVKINP